MIPYEASALATNDCVEESAALWRLVVAQPPRAAQRRTMAARRATVPDMVIPRKVAIRDLTRPCRKCVAVSTPKSAKKYDAEAREKSRSILITRHQVRRN